jgi:hypothetical protein
MLRRDFFKAAALPLAFSTSNLFGSGKKDLASFLPNYFHSIDTQKLFEDNLKSDISTIDNNKKKEVKKSLYVDQEYEKEFVSVRKKLRQIQNYVGYGNFNIISFDEMLKIAKRVESINSFSQKELDFLESIFYYDPRIHGFFGEKVSNKITDKINKADVVKISGTGHYLFKGEPYSVYFRMLKDVGDSLILTSGVRSIVKQTKLFLDKIYSVEGNITTASKSLAPPAFTYHSVADFDVGKKGFGHANFSPRFALTQEFFKMRRLKYIDMRYTINNKDGVRYEPWHVKVI